MRTRVLAPILGCVLLVVLAVLAPALESISRQRTQELVLKRSASLARFATLARAGIDSGDTTALEQHGRTYVGLYGEPVLVIDPAGRAIFRSDGIDPTAPDVAAAATAARRNQPLEVLPVVYPWSATSHLMAQPVVGTGDVTGGAVVTRVDAARAVSDVRARWALAAAIAAFGLTLLTVLGLLLARWVLRPVRELDRASHDLGAGRMPEALRRSGPPELQRLARSFDEMATSVTATISERRRLVEDFSHRLRNPLAAVRLRVDSLHVGESDPARTSALTQVDRDLDRLETMVDTMLDLAEAEHRAGAGSVPALLHPDDRPLRLTSDLFPAEVVGRWVGPAAERGVRLRREGDDHVMLRCSSRDVHDIVDELVENAVKYAGPGAEVVVRCTTGGGWARLEVSDTGAGLGDDELPRAVDRFWRAPGVADTDGTGLGLAIVTALARANGGHVTVASNVPHGLRVTVRLPTGGEG